MSTQEQLIYPWFLRPTHLRGSAREGTIRDDEGARVVVLSDDLIRGLHRAIAEETGQAMPIITYTCGRKWGERVVARWSKGWEKWYGVSLAEAEMAAFERWLDACFRYHGWGTVELDFGLEREGLLQVILRESVFERLLEDVDSPWLNGIFAGLFASLVSHITGREIECIEVASTRTGADHARFVCALPERIERAQLSRLGGDGTDAIMQALAA